MRFQFPLARRHIRVPLPLPRASSSCARPGRQTASSPQPPQTESARPHPPIDYAPDPKRIPRFSKPRTESPPAPPGCAVKVPSISGSTDIFQIDANLERKNGAVFRSMNLALVVWDSGDHIVQSERQAGRVDRLLEADRSEIGWREYEVVNERPPGKERSEPPPRRLRRHPGLQIDPLESSRPPSLSPSSCPQLIEHRLLTNETVGSITQVRIHFQ